MGIVIVRCDRCIQIKKKCDGNLPCSTCSSVTRKTVECTYNAASASAAAEAAKQEKRAAAFLATSALAAEEKQSRKAAMAEKAEAQELVFPPVNHALLDKIIVEFCAWIRHAWPQVGEKLEHKPSGDPDLFTDETYINFTIILYFLFQAAIKYQYGDSYYAVEKNGENNNKCYYTRKDPGWADLHKNFEQQPRNLQDLSRLRQVFTECHRAGTAVPEDLESFLGKLAEGPGLWQLKVSEDGAEGDMYKNEENGGVVEVDFEDMYPPPSRYSSGDEDDDSDEDDDDDDEEYGDEDSDGYEYEQDEDEEDEDEDEDGDEDMTNE